uniref:VWFA domain-containing protein n=1 Tax=Caenorhabditis japonica TaxID=281687 RepID=A0A8R1HJP8_CAEJA
MSKILGPGPKPMCVSTRMNPNNREQVDNWISNFIVYGFVQTSQKTIVNKTITYNADDVIGFLDRMELLDGDDTQPVLTALKNAQQTFPEMKSHGIVLVLTDSPASDATPWSHRFTDKNAEQSCIQLSLLWRSKLTFLLSLPNGTDFSSNGVDVYRRISMTNHGDTFFILNATELKEILLKVIGFQYFSENLAVGYGQTEKKQISVTVDEEGEETVFYLITFYPSDGLLTVSKN